jgi:septum formation protein
MKPYIILASGSARRAQILQEHGFEFCIQPANIEEKTCSNLSPEEQAIQLAIQKAQAVAKKIDWSKQKKSAILLAADTIVAIDRRMFGKPKDKQEAAMFLKELSHTAHRIITGFTLYLPSGHFIQDKEVTYLSMVPFSDLEIQEYVEGGQWRDKAGGYGIQDFNDQRIQKITGDYENIVGLPIRSVAGHLKQLGFTVTC